MPHFEFDRAKLAYVEKGGGETVLLVHGSASDYRTWEIQLEEFGKKYRTIAYSRRYHWPNEKIPEGADYSMLEHVDDLGTVIDSLDAGRIHLVGHSYGAFVCLLYALRQTGKVRSLVLAEPPAITLFVSSRPKPAELLKLLVTRPTTALAIIKFAAGGVIPATKAIKSGDRESALEALGRGTLGIEAFRALSDDRREQARANLIDAELLGSGFAPIDQEALRHVDTPTLLLVSENSPPMFGKLADRLSELLPRVTRARIESASHIMHEDNPDQYNRTVLSFLESQSVKDS